MLFTIMTWTHALDIARDSLFLMRKPVSIASVGPLAQDNSVHHSRAGPQQAGTRNADGIDAPERGQAGYGQAAGVLSSMIEGKTVHCLQVGEGTVCDGRSRPTSRDRIVAQCFLDKVDIAEQMTRSGTACDWPRFSGGRYKISDTTCSRK